MIGVWIAVFLIIQFFVLVFVLALCRSAALTDREFDRARIREHRAWSNTPEWVEGNKEVYVSADMKTATRFG